MHTLVMIALALLAVLGWAYHQRRLQKMSDHMDFLEAQVSATEGRVDAAMLLIADLADRLDDAADDPEQVRALATRLREKGAQLAQAIETYNPDARPPAEDPPAGEDTQIGGSDTETVTGADVGSFSEVLGDETLTGSTQGGDSEPAATLTDFAAADAANAGNDSTQA